MFVGYGTVKVVEDVCGAWNCEGVEHVFGGNMWIGSIQEFKAKSYKI